MSIQKPRPVIIGAFSPPALACIRSWGRQGFAVGMVCIRSQREPPPGSRYLQSYCTLPSDKLFTDEGARRIDAYLRQFHASGIMAIDEKISCWLNDCRAASGLSAEVWAPPNQVARDLMPKSRQVETARSVGMDLLPTYAVDRDHETVNSIPRDSYPLCLRPDLPIAVSPAFKVRIVHTRKELLEFLARCDRIDRPIMAQPFADLPNLVVHGSRTVSGKTSGLQAFAVHRKFQGVSLTIRPYSMEPALADMCAEFVNRLGLIGNFHFDFLLDQASGRNYFLEINARLGGTTAKVLACGYDEPMLALEAYGIAPSPPLYIRDRVVSSKHALLKYCCFALSGRLSLLDHPREPAPVRLLKSIYGLVFYGDEILSFSDMRGAIAFYRSLMPFH